MERSKLTSKTLIFEIRIADRELCCSAFNCLLFYSLGLLSRSASEFHRFLFGTEPIWQTRKNLYCPFSYLYRFFSNAKDLGKTGKSGCDCFSICIFIKKLLFIRSMLFGNLSPNSFGPYWNASIFTDYNGLQPPFKT